MENIGDQCVECGKSSARGSGRFVNRVPADTDTLSGFMCGVCVDQNTDVEVGDTAFNVQDFKRTDPEEDPRIGKLERMNKQLYQENCYLKESRPQETLEETITEVLCDQWIDYMDSKGNNRDHDNGMCPANLEREFIELITELRRFFENHRKPSPDSYSSHDYTKRVVMTASAKAHNKIGMATLDLSPLQWELMVAITKYVEGHVIDSDDIIYVAEKR